MLTSSPRQTLLLRWPRWTALPAAALLAVGLHPAVHLLQKAVMHLYPLSDEMQQALAGLESVFRDAPWWQVVLLVAATPAVCEELAFRGFIFTGLRRTGSAWRTIGVSAVFFGLSHGILQQSLIASLIGVLLGWLALRTGSILPGMVFHFVHNSLGVLSSRIPASFAAEWPFLGALVQSSDQGGVTFSWPAVVAGGLVSLLILAWMSRQDRRGPESLSVPAENVLVRG